MRQFLNIMFLILSLTSLAQTADLKGHVTYRDDKSDFVGANVYLYKDGRMVINCLTGKDGNFILNDIAVGSYVLRLKYLDFKEKLIPKVLVASGMKSLEIVYPDPCITAEKVCPYGHKNNIIPIVYGMPGEETIKKAQNGLVHLAGCVVSDCEPLWYCNTHEISF